MKMVSKNLTNYQKARLFVFLKELYPEKEFSWENYGKPYSTSGIDIIHVISKTGKARIDGVEINTYSHDYFHWFELLSIVELEKKTDLSKYVLVDEKNIPEIGPDEILEYKDMTGTWYEYTKTLQDNPYFTPDYTRIRKI